MERDELERKLNYIILRFKNASKDSERWRRLVLDGKVEFSSYRENCARKFYIGWLKYCQPRLAAIDSFENDGHKIANADEFRKCVEACRGILTPDSEYFTELHDLRDAAIDEHREGRTLPLE